MERRSRSLGAIHLIGFLPRGYPSTGQGKRVLAARNCALEVFLSLHLEELRHPLYEDDKHQVSPSSELYIRKS